MAGEFGAGLVQGFQKQLQEVEAIEKGNRELEAKIKMKEEEALLTEEAAVKEQERRINLEKKKSKLRQDEIRLKAELAGEKPKGLTPEEFGLVPPTPKRIAPFQERFPTGEGELLVPGPGGTVIGGRGEAARPLSPSQAATRLYETRGKKTRERVKGLGLQPEVGIGGKEVGLKRIAAPKEPKVTETKEFRESLSNAITAIERGTVSVEEALNRLYKDWPDKERTLEDFRGRMESLTR